MSSLVDTHCHLDFYSFDNDRSQVLDRAWDNGLERILVPGINLDSSRVALKLADLYERVYVAVGVHPNDALSWQVDTLDQLRRLTDHPKVVAIGEIGLDYYRNRAPRELQIEIFQKQLSLASQVNLPVVIHNRDASNDMMEIISKWQISLESENSSLANRPGVLHSFSEDIDIAEKGMAHHFYIGITGPVTFKNADNLRRTISAIPLDHLLIETDAPFLTPHPFRGKRNEPAYVRFVADGIAQILELTLETVATTTTSNAKNLLNW